MSKIGRKPIVIPQGVTVSQEGASLTISAKDKTIILPMLAGVSCVIQGNELIFSSRETSKQEKANWGTMRALTHNAISGVQKDFSKVLELEGIGFKAALEGKVLVLNLGFSHQVRFEIPHNITITVDKNTITVSGINKELVGATAAKIRSLKKPEPYKGKGIHYKGEVIRRKAGKKVGATAGAA